MILFFGVSLVFIFGYLLSLLIAKEMRLLERLGVSFLLGFGIFTLLMFCYSSLGVKITLPSTALILFIGIFLQLILLKILKYKVSINPLSVIKSFSTFSLLEKIIVCTIMALMIGSLVLSIYFPVYIWDALALYDFRARVIAQQGFYTQIANNFSYFTGYPLFTSLSHVLVYIFKGNNPQFLYSFMYISYIFIFHSNLRQFADRKKTLITTLLLTTISIIFDHSTFAYTNLPYTIFLSLGSIYLFTWFTKKKPTGYLILAGIFTGLSTWSRAAEPFWMINLLALILLVLYKFKRYILPGFVYIISFLIIKVPWNLINYGQLADSKVIINTSAITTEVGSYGSMLSIVSLNHTRITEVVTFLYRNIIISWFPLLFLFVLCITLNLRGFYKKDSTLFLILFLLYFVSLVCATYIFSFVFVGWSAIPDSARRMSMFFMPLMIFYIGLSLGESKNKI